MNIQVLDKSYLAEVQITGGSTSQQFNFPTLNNLDGKFTQGMSAYGVGAMPKAPSGSTVIGATLFNSCFVNLFVGDVDQYWNMPLNDFVTIRNSASASTVYYNPYAIEFNNVQIIWAKSFIFVADTSLLPAAGTNLVVPVLIKYTDGVISKEPRN